MPADNLRDALREACDIIDRGGAIERNRPPLIDFDDNLLSL